MTTVTISEPIIIEVLPVAPELDGETLTPEFVASLWPKYNLLPETGHADVRNGKTCALGILRVEYGDVFPSSSGSWSEFGGGLTSGFDGGVNALSARWLATGIYSQSFVRGVRFGVAVRALVLPESGD